MNRGATLAVYRGDPILLMLGGALVSIGLIAIASASIEYSDFHFNNPWHHTERHALYLLAGLTAGGFAYTLPLETLQRLSPWMLFFAFALLILVLMPGIGREVNGAQRWLPLGSITVQPSEIAKLALLLYAYRAVPEAEATIAERAAGA